MTFDFALQGRRVVLRDCTDPFTKLTAGDEGTVTFVDDTGTVHVKWDTGSHLGLVPGEDRWDLLPSDPVHGPVDDDATTYPGPGEDR